MTEPMQAAADRFDTVCMTILATADGNLGTPMTVRQLNDLTKAVSDLMRAQNANLIDSHNTIVELRDAWYTMADEIGVRRDGRLLD